MLRVKQGERYRRDIGDTWTGWKVQITLLYLRRLFVVIVIFADNKEELQLSLNALHEYSNRWNVVVSKTRQS